jgi:pSer/pThr/pTyr-binding forkhead associated (FHA) protein
MFRADGERRSFSITRDITVIGRREDCDFRIPLGDISRKHCRIIRDTDTLKIEDLGSSNGTFVNGQRVQEALLSPGDTLSLGSVVFVLQIDGAPTDDQLQPMIPEAHDAPQPPSTEEPQEQVPAAEPGQASEFDPMSILGAGDSSELTPLDDSGIAADLGGSDEDDRLD